MVAEMEKMYCSGSGSELVSSPNAVGMKGQSSAVLRNESAG
jgi:hypothetical protein